MNLSDEARDQLGKIAYEAAYPTLAERVPFGPIDPMNRERWVRAAEAVAAAVAAVVSPATTEGE